jgi:hypothetical protein
MENIEVTEDSYQVRKLLPHLPVDRKRYFSDWRIPSVRRRSDDGCEAVLRPHREEQVSEREKTSRT